MLKLNIALTTLQQKVVSILFLLLLDLVLVLNVQTVGIKQLVYNAKQPVLLNVLIIIITTLVFN